MFQIYVRLVGEVLVDDCILSGIYKLVMNLQILERQGTSYLKGVSTGLKNVIP